MQHYFYACGIILNACFIAVILVVAFIEYTHYKKNKKLKAFLEKDEGEVFLEQVKDYLKSLEQV